MKKIGFIVFAVAVIAGIVFASLFSTVRTASRLFNLNFGSSVSEAEDRASDARDLTNFDSVEVSGVFDVRIIAQTDFSVQIDADESILRSIKSEVDSRVLKLETTERLKSRTPIVVTIGAPDIERVQADGAARIAITNLSNDSLDIDASGASSVTAAGSTGRLNVLASGASKINAEALAAAEADIDISGASLAAVSTQNTLWAKASGASTLTYAGDPQTVENTATGASTINKKK